MRAFLTVLVLIVGLKTYSQTQILVDIFEYYEWDFGPTPLPMFLINHDSGSSWVNGYSVFMNDSVFETQLDSTYLAESLSTLQFKIAWAWIAGFDDFEISIRSYVETLQDDGLVLEMSIDEGNTWKNVADTSYWNSEELDVFYGFDTTNFTSQTPNLVGIQEIPSQNNKLGIGGHWGHSEIYIKLHTEDKDMFFNTWFRFIFSSDSIQGNSTGIILDHMKLWMPWMSIEEDGDQVFVMFPNPTSSTIKLELEKSLHNGIIELYSMTGQLIMTHAFAGTMTEIDFSELAKGSYVVIIKDGNTVVGREIVVKE
jgi:hypothetical protein